MTILFAYIDSPFGEVLASATSEAVTGVYFVGQKYMPEIAAQWQYAPDRPLFRDLALQLHEYGSGKLRRFEVPFAFDRGTEFQRKVWREIAAIPYGKTITYGQLAQRIGAPNSVRAAGAATGRNPISLIVPCHRIVGSDGSLTGYAGGIERKKLFLELEGSGVATTLELFPQRTRS